MKRTIANLTVEITEGNIVDQPDIDAIVNAANAQLRTGGGVAGAIHRAAGPGLEEECRSLAPIKPGQAVITSGHKLPNPWVIHCLGPVYGVDTPADLLLADCYSNALMLAEKNDLKSVAFCSISTGVFGYPMREAATVAFQTVANAAPQLKSVRTVRFVLFGQQAFQIHSDVLSDLISGSE